MSAREFRGALREKCLVFATRFVWITIAINYGRENTFFFFFLLLNPVMV